ncbi:MAG: amino acid adenylation domain-containing protein [Bacteroidota bacterium]
MSTLPLTNSQLLLWAGQEMLPDVPLYNMAMRFDIQGSLDPDRFQTAWELTVRQTDVLRSIFVKDGNFPCQRILPEMPAAMIRIDFEEEEDPRSAAEQWIKDRVQHPLDLEHCAWEAALFRLNEQQWIWYLNPHHLILDIGSIALVFERLAENYEGKHAHAAVSFPLFQTYVEQEVSSRGQISEQSREFLTQTLGQLSASPPVLYGQENQHKESATVRRKIELGERRSHSLKHLAQITPFRSFTQDLSVFQILATVYAAWLHRVSGQQRLSFGVPVHSRRTQNARQTAGMLVEVLPLVLEVGEKDSFLDVFRTVRQVSADLFRHTQAGMVSPELGRSFHAVLNFISTRFSPFGNIPVHTEWLHPGHADPGHHVRMHVCDLNNSGSFQLLFDLNCAVFDADMRSAIPQHILAILDAMLEDPTQDIHTLDFCTEEEKQKILIDFNQTYKDFAVASVLDLFQRQCSLTPNLIAVSDRETDWTYEALNDAASRLAARLSRLDVGDGSVVGLYQKRHPNFLISVLAVWKVGGAYVPIPANHPPERVITVLKDAEVACVISQEGLVDPLKNFGDIILCMDSEWEVIMEEEPYHPSEQIPGDSLAYVMYTSGSTGQPKGVMISHHSLTNYVQWAADTYTEQTALRFPFFTMIGFDLTVTSLFVPLISGGSVVVYEEPEQGPDLSIFNVLQDNQVTAIKLTPSHFALVDRMDWQDSRLQCMIVGGEDFQTHLAERMHAAFEGKLRIYNEYGPTEATVGCIVHQYESGSHTARSVPIGRPIANLQAYVLDNHLNPVPKGVAGNLYISGVGLAKGYLNHKELTEEQFVDTPFARGSRMYQTGDIARLSAEGVMEYLGRKDQQLKFGGIRIELGEIEAILTQHPAIESVVVDVAQQTSPAYVETEHACTQCGLPFNYPDAHFDEQGVCHLCHSFNTYQEKAARYFRSETELKHLLQQQRKSEADYDCIMLLSGGKDSSYALARLVEMGARVLAYTLDNGYISEQAKTNVRQVVSALGVDHIFGSTSAMNAIFVDSLQRFSNVCNGCFKTLYTLSTRLALDKGIPCIVTGLSRGQFFETRLTEELFRGEEVNVSTIDQTILDARRAYHRVEDAVSKHLDVSMFDDDAVFEKVQFIDFYRYCDVSLEEMMRYLDQRLPWQRPTDTGRSTNCLINQLGIYIHKRERGYHNYAFPYSWDVRIGHKTREETLEEINEQIDETEVEQIMKEIGYTPRFSGPREAQLTAWFVAASNPDSTVLRDYLAAHLPPYMIPTVFSPISAIPLTPNGKVDRQSLKSSMLTPQSTSSEYVAPETEIEEMLLPIWEEVLHLNQLSILDDFLALGGNSLAAIRLMARVNELFGLELALTTIFERPTVRTFGEYVEETILNLMES